MKGLRKILRVSWTAKKTNEWVLSKAGVKMELLDTVKTRKLAYYGHTMTKQGNRLEKEIMQETMPGARRRGRPRTAWIDNIKTSTALSIRMGVLSNTLVGLEPWPFFFKRPERVSMIWGNSSTASKATLQLVASGE